jgi:Putative transposase of IS4/5 family (DUF4096)
MASSDVDGGLRTGCPWRYRPRDSFSPRSTVYNIFRKFQRDGVWESSARYAGAFLGSN